MINVPRRGVPFLAFFLWGGDSLGGSSPAEKLLINDQCRFVFQCLLGSLYNGPQRHSKVELGGHVLVNAFYKHPVALPPCQELLGNKLQSSQSKEDTPCLSLDW